MTREAFHRLMVDPKRPARLDVMLEQNARTDAARAERAQRERNEAIVTRYLRSQWQAEAKR